jgi:hypothetical protein
MINTHYKIQPVAAFYKLLGSSTLFILSCSLILSTLAFFIIKLSLLNVLGVDGIKELGQFMERQSTDMKEQSKAMQDFILKYPSLVPAMVATFALILVLFSYLIYISQQFLKAKSLLIETKFITYFIPSNKFINILLFLILSSGFFVFSSGFIALSISANPVIGVIAGIFLGMLLVRSCLFIPGVTIGEMTFGEAIKYSVQTISLGRAFKIVIFGTLIFLMLSFILSALVYFPSIWFKTYSAKMYLNILVLFLQVSFISVGMTALFLRYGNFEEEKIAE